MKIISDLTALLGCFFLSGVAPALGQGKVQEDRSVNLVLVLVDDLGWSDGGAFGSKYYETPNVDRLVSEGVRFTQAYAACAVCSPSRAALLTGRNPARIGVTDWIHHRGPEAQEDIAAGKYLGGFERSRGRSLLTPRNRAWLPAEELTLAEVLSAEGYATAHIGKWHLGPEGHYPTDQGFDLNKGGFQVGQPPGWFDPFAGDGFDGIYGLESRKPGEYLTDREGDEAVAFIEANRERPFFLYLAHYAVHAPIVGPQDLVAKYQAKQPSNHRVPAYAAMVEAVDQTLGRVLETLERLQLDANTLVIYTSDNGGATHFPATDNAPLRRGKGFPYEGGLRVPFVARLRGRIPPGRIVDEPLVGTDLLPTICTALGVNPPKNRTLDGVDLWPAFTGRGELQEHSQLLWHFPHYWWGTHVHPYSVLREGAWKLIQFYDGAPSELYHLGRDPSELSNQAQQEAERVARMSTHLKTELVALGARFPKPNPAQKDK